MRHVEQNSLQRIPVVPSLGPATRGRGRKGKGMDDKIVCVKTVYVRGSGGGLRRKRGRGGEGWKRLTKTEEKPSTADRRTDIRVPPSYRCLSQHVSK